MLSYPKSSKERRNLADLLRKRGNFICSAAGNVRTVRKNVVDDNPVPCSHCLGYFSSRQLYKHIKICPHNLKKEKSSQRYAHQINGQNLLIRHLVIDRKLKDMVFPHMKPDKISFVAKSDKLISAYGARYFNTHRAKHHIPVTSRKMRDLAKLLLAAQELKPNIKSFFDLLQPHYFDTIVSATKVVAKYNPQTEIYESPTYALNISTAIKECCDLAQLFIIKKKCNFESTSASDAESNVRVMKTLIASNWKYEISTQAGNDLLEKKWNKLTLIPTAGDLITLKNYLQKTSRSAADQLVRNESDRVAYFLLMETVYCRIILLNRKRPGELQRLPLELYKTKLQNPGENSDQYDGLLTETEKILLGRLKRIVFKGKRGRGVPILFPPDVCAHADLLVRFRSNFVNRENLHFFAAANSNEPLTGYKVLARHVKKSNVQYPETITCTRLRKHLATMSQVINMSDNDIDQLANFMGHTLGIHKNFYRLPDDVHQTAKIAKLLFLMEQGQGKEFKGKKLDDIEISTSEEVEVNLEEDDNNPDDPEPFENDVIELSNPEPRRTSKRGKISNLLAQFPDKSLISATTSSSQNTCEAEDANEDLDEPRYEKKSVETDKDKDEIVKEPERKKRRQLVPWTEEQKIATRKYFKNHIKNRIPPKKSEVENLMKETGLFANKTWAVIKVFVQNSYKKS
jgi:hypothetical protein